MPRSGYDSGVRRSSGPRPRNERLGEVAGSDFLFASPSRLEPMEQAMAQEALLQPELNGFPVAVMRIDRRLQPIGANHAWKNLFGALPRAEVDAWLEVFEPDERDRVVGLARRVQETHETSVFEAQGLKMDQWLEVRIASAHDVERSAELMVVALDISEQKRREALLRFDVLHDPLTGVHNRVALLDNVQLALARLGRRPSILAVLYIDLDHFKEVNDRHGHQVGDQVLIQAAQRMRLAIRPADMLARIGGDEFIALCESFGTVDEVRAVANRLKAAFDEPIRAGGTAIVCPTASVGVALAASPTIAPKGLLHRADQAMYRAKQEGSGRVYIDATVGNAPTLSQQQNDTWRARVLGALWSG